MYDVRVDQLDKRILAELLLEMSTGEFWVNAPREEVQEMLEIIWMRLHMHSDSKGVVIAKA